jgi:aminoglycoside phosphotransferase (APT) family kinase protein
VPEPLAVYEPWNIWLQRKVVGDCSTDLLFGEGADAIAERTADALYKIHRTGPPAARMHTLADELQILHQRLGELAESRPLWQVRLERLSAACDRLAASLAPSRATTIHRDFYPDQVLVEGSHVTICDWDLYCFGDPAVDVGNYAAHVLEQSLRQLGTAAALQSVATAFISNYLRLNKKVAPPTVDAYTTLSLVRHISISAEMPSRKTFTESLLDYCESRLKCHTIS